MRAADSTPDSIPAQDSSAALRRILGRAGTPDLIDLLANDLSGADLTTVLLEVFRRRATRNSPADVMRRYRSDRFVTPGPIPFSALRRTEDALLRALPQGNRDGFEVLVLSPLLPLAAHCAVATVDPRNVVATIRGTEASADPTNALALEAALRRSHALAADPHSSEPVRLAALQRVTRAQQFGNGAGAHFQLFGVVTATRDTGNRASERWMLAEQLSFAVRAMAAAGARRTQIRLTPLDEAAAAILEGVREDLAGLPDVDVLEDRGRETGRGYYTGVCFKVFAAASDDFVEIGDGGFVDWSRKLLENHKERLLISGFGVDRLAALTA